MNKLGPGAVIVAGVGGWLQDGATGDGTGKRYPFGFRFLVRAEN